MTHQAIEALREKWRGHQRHWRNMRDDARANTLKAVAGRCEARLELCEAFLADLSSLSGSGRQAQEKDKGTGLVHTYNCGVYFCANHPEGKHECNMRSGVSLLRSADR
jgi:hypothetical protein